MIIKSDVLLCIGDSVITSGNDGYTGSSLDRSRDPRPEDVCRVEVAGETDTENEQFDQYAAPYKRENG